MGVEATMIVVCVAVACACWRAVRFSVSEAPTMVAPRIMVTSKSPITNCLGRLYSLRLIAHRFCLKGRVTFPVRGRPAGRADLWPLRVALVGPELLPCGAATAGAALRSLGLASGGVGL